MNIVPLKTERIAPGSASLTEILDRYLPTMGERNILAVTSKLVAVCEGRLVRVSDTDKQALIQEEADLYLPPHISKYDLALTVKHNILIPNAGIDQSNGDGSYILWPADPQASANRLRAYLAARFGLKEVGVIITDSKTTPLRRGTTGVGLTHSGFQALRNYVGTPDIYGEPLRMTKANILDGLAAAAVLAMGEGSEQTPLALISDTGFVKFTDGDPSEAELSELHIDLEDDLYAPLLTAVGWEQSANKTKGTIED